MGLSDANRNKQARKETEKMITCDICPRCKDEYPDKVDRAGNHFCICGMSGNIVYTAPRRERRLFGGGYIYYGVSGCGLYESVEDAYDKVGKWVNK